MLAESACRFSVSTTARTTPPVASRGSPCLFVQKPEPAFFFGGRANTISIFRNSWLIGDILDDVEAGIARMQVILLFNGHETEWVLPGDACRK